MRRTNVLKTLFATVILITLIQSICAFGLELEVYEDEESFWSPTPGGSGSIDLQIVEETSQVNSGSSSLQFEVISGKYDWVNIQHGYTVNQDWSSYENFEIMWYGQNSGEIFTINIEASSYTDRFSETFIDDFTGWQKITLPLSDFTQYGSASWSAVKKILIVFAGSTQTSWYIDKTSLGAPPYSISYTIQENGAIDFDLSGPYAADTIVTVTASAADPEWIFLNWGGDLSGFTNPTTIVMNSDKSIFANFISNAVVQVSTSSTQYLVDTNFVIQVRDGTSNGIILMQVNMGGTVKWHDQRKLDSQGDLDFSIKIPNDWVVGTYTLYVKDHESGSSATRTFSITSPTPPPPSGGDTGGGGIGVTIPSVTVIELSTPKDAAKLLKDFDADDVANVLEQVQDLDHISEIFGYFDLNYAIQVIMNLPPDLGGQILSLLDIDISSEIIGGFDSDQKDILEYMLNYNYSHTAQMIENSIKKITFELNESERKETLKNFAEALASLDNNLLIDVLISISRLPETPSTVAYIFEAMNHKDTLDLIELWTSEQYTEAIPDLVDVLDYLSIEVLGEIYIDVDENTRITLIGALSTSTIYSLPRVTTFEISKLKVTPPTITVGETITLSYVLSNIGEKTDVYNLTLTLNGIKFGRDEGVLSPGESINFTYYLSVDVPDEYQVQVDGRTIAFQAEEESTEGPVEDPSEPEPSINIIVSAIEVVPITTYPGEVSIILTITNTGDSSGTGEYKVYLDGVEVKSSEVFIPLGGTVNQFFTVTSNEIGNHIVSSGDISTSFEVIKTSPKIPWLTVLVIIMIVIGSLYIMVYYNLIELDTISKVRERFR